MLGRDVGLWKIEWKYWLNKLALLESVLESSEGILLDLVMDLRYLNILLLLDEEYKLMRCDSKFCLTTLIDFVLETVFSTGNNTWDMMGGMALESTTECS